MGGSSHHYANHSIVKWTLRQRRPGITTTRDCTAKNSKTWTLVCLCLHCFYVHSLSHGRSCRFCLFAFFFFFLAFSRPSFSESNWRAKSRQHTYKHSGNMSKHSSCHIRVREREEQIQFREQNSGTGNSVLYG